MSWFHTRNGCSMKWNGLNSAGVRVSSGIYFYKLETKDFTQVRKLLLAK